MSDSKNFLILLSVLLLFIVVGCAASQPVIPTPSAPLPNNLYLNGEAQKKAAALHAHILILPENFDGWQLQSLQLPDSSLNNPFLFTYSNGSQIFTLTEFSGKDISFQSALPSIGRLEGAIQIRSGIDATYIEEIRTEGKNAELKWHEDSLVVSLRSERLDQKELVQIANALEFAK